MDFNEQFLITKPEDEVQQVKKGVNPIISAMNEEQQAINAQRQENIERYQVSVPDEVYEVLNMGIAASEIPEEEAYKIASAYKLTEAYNIDLQDARENLDNYTAALFGPDHGYTPKTAFTAIVDSLTLGTNTFKLAKLGHELINAELEDDNPLTEKLYQQLDLLEKENERLADHQPRNWFIEAVKMGAQTAPFSGAVMATGVFGNLIAPGVGTAAAFAESMLLAQGLEYIALRKAGANNTISRNTSGVVGILNAVVETSLGTLAGTLGAAAKAIGKGTGVNLLSRTVTEKITANVFKRLHVNNLGFKAVARVLTNSAMDNIGEGVEEAVQELISAGGKALAAEIQGYGVERDTAQEVAAQAFEAFRGGIMGSLVLGVSGITFNSIAEVKDFKALKEASESIPSKEAFIRSTENNLAFSKMTDEQKKEAQLKIWDQAAKKRESITTASAEELTETIAFGDGYETTIETEDGDVIDKAPVYRTDKGELYTENTDVSVNQDGRTSGVYKVGGFQDLKTNEEGQTVQTEKPALYGSIDYEVDPETETVHIKKFVVTSGRENIRQEFYEKFADEFAGNTIEWDVKTPSGIAIRDKLMSVNPRGKDAGLTYYSGETDIATEKTKIKIKNDLKKYMPALSETERAVAVDLLDAHASSVGKDISQYVNETFGDTIFTNEGQIKEASDLAQAQGAKVKGAVQFTETQNDVKALIYAGEKADFSTFVHETAHIYRRQMQGELKAKAEKAFNVQNGTWTRAQEEDFAVGLEDYLRTGKAKNEELKTLFEQVKEFLQKIYKALKNRINITPEIEEVYESLFASRDAQLNQAIKKENTAKTESAQNTQTVETEQEQTQEVQEETAAEPTTKQTVQSEREQEVDDLIKRPEVSSLEKVQEALDIAGEKLEEEKEVYRSIRDMSREELLDLVLLNNVSHIPSFRAYQEDIKLNGKKKIQVSLDADSLKFVNDNMDHKSGDELLQKIGIVLDIYAEKYNVLIYHKSGDEFLAQADDLESYIRFFDEVQNKLRVMPIVFTDKKNGVTITKKGIQISDGIDTNGDMEAADRRLQDEKLYRESKGERAGRDQIPSDIILSTDGNGNNIDIDPARYFEDRRAERKRLAGTKREIQGSNDPLSPEGKRLLVEKVLKTKENQNRNTEDLLDELKEEAEKKAVLEIPPDLFFQEITDDTLQEIKDAYKNTDSWLKAPNGKNTNLSERQWLQVRTPEFKQWFGDWEADPQNASKVVDENGEPLVVYHGTKNTEFDVFDLNKTGSATDTGMWGKGFYFCNDINESTRYARQGRILPLFLSIRKPYIIDNKESIPDIKVPNKTKEDLKLSAVNYSSSFTNLLTQQGFDGVRVSMNENYIEFVAHRPNQIKSATDNSGAFSRANPSILFQFVGENAVIEEDEKKKLQQAKQMDSDGEDQNKIRKATGWFKIKKDGKWRMEIPNKNVVLITGNDLINEQPLPKVLKYPELYKRYPEAENIKISYLPADKDDGTLRGDFNIETGHIRISKLESLQTEVFGSLFHELQHWIQSKEEFSQGGNSQKLRKERSEYYKILDIKKLYESARTILTMGKDTLEENINLYEDFIGDKTSPYILDLLKYYDIDTINERIEHFDKELKKSPFHINYYSTRDPYEVYYNTTGEIEARDVTERIGYSDSQRLDITPHLLESEAAGDILFQTEGELAAEAATFDTWQDFYEYYSSWAAPEDAAVPTDADTTWYQTFWEKAKGIYPEESASQDEVTRRAQEDALTEGDPTAQDALFMVEIEKPGKLESFLTELVKVDRQEVWQPIDEEDNKVLQELVTLKNRVKSELAHGSWLTNAARVISGKPITHSSRKRLLTLIRNNSRDYRDIYAEIMNIPEWKVEKKDSTAQALANKLPSTKPEDFEDMTPERRRQIALDIENEEIARKVESGTIPMGEELDRYIKTIKKQKRESDKKLIELEAEIKEDYKHLSESIDRDFIAMYDEMLTAKARWTNHSDRTSRAIDKGIKLAEKYDKDSSRLKTTYESLYRRIKDYQEAHKLSGEITEAIAAREAAWAERKKNTDLKREDTALQQVKKLRIQLVKRTMRRVPFDRIDYDNARTVIAIQRIFQPNLVGGVNAWIGTERPWVYSVYSQFNFDDDFRTEITRSLLNGGKQAGVILKLLESGKDFKEWTPAEIKSASRVIPKENWVYSLNLKSLAEEREGSIQQDIRTVVKERAKLDENGNRVTDTNGNPVMEKYDAIEFSDEIRDMVENAVGSELFYKLIKKPFNAWELNEMEALAKKVNDLYVEGKKLLEAKKEAKRQQAALIREKIEQAVKDTGIQINENDSEEVKERKLKKINKILGHNATIKGTLQDKQNRESLVNRILHSYADANVRRVARILDNYSDGINTTMLYYREDECFNTRERNIRERTAKINQAIKEAELKLPDLYKTVTFENWYDGEPRTLTYDELLYYMKAAEDQNSFEAVCYGSMIDVNLRDKYKVIDNNAQDMEFKLLDPNNPESRAGPGTQEYDMICRQLYNRILDKAKEIFTSDEGKKYLTLANAITSDYDLNYERLNKVCIEEFNKPLWRVDKYIPLMRQDVTGDTNAKVIEQDLMGLSGSSQNYVGKGFTNKRIFIAPLNQTPVKAGLYSTWTESVERTEHFLSYAGYVRDLNRVYKSRDGKAVNQWIRSRYGKGMADYIDDYINEVANPLSIGQKSKLDDFMRALRGGTGTAYLGWKMSGLVKQAITSPAPFFQFVNPVEYASAAFELTTKKGAVDAVKEKSAFMASRTMDPIINLIKEQEQKATNKLTYGISKFNKLGMAGLEAVDFACVAPGWLAVYKKEYAFLTKQNEATFNAEVQRLTEENIEREMNDPMWKMSEVLTPEQIQTEAEKVIIEADEIERLAVRKADDATRMCQPSGRLADLAPLFKSRFELQKTFLQFQTSLNVIWQNLRYDIPDAVRNKEFGKIISMIGSYAAAGIAVTMITEGFSDDDDEEKKVKEFIYSATTQFTMSVPIIAGLVDGATKKLITGETAYNQGTTLIPFADKLYKGTVQAGNAEWDKAAKYFAEGVGLALGAPVSGAKEALRVIGVGDGEDGLDFAPEALIGRR